MQTILLFVVLNITYNVIVPLTLCSLMHLLMWSGVWGVSADRLFRSSSTWVIQRWNSACWSSNWRHSNSMSSNCSFLWLTCDCVSVQWSRRRSTVTTKIKTWIQLQQNIWLSERWSRRRSAVTTKIKNINTTTTRLHKSRSSRSELEFDLSNFV